MSDWSRADFDAVVRDRAVPEWVDSLLDAHPLHPVINKLLDKYEPESWFALLYQWPHVSMKDPQRLAYTPSEEYAKRNRVTVTSLGKYVAKHWPSVPSHELRDIVLLGSGTETMKFVYAMSEMIMGVEYGPQSCMASASSYCGHMFKNADDGFARLADWKRNPELCPEPDWLLHPYASYDPQDGWHMALRYEDDIIMARALCLNFEGGKYFVRSYKRDPNNVYSPTDGALNAWLRAQGYAFVSAWPEGATLRISENCAPYLDGGIKRVTHYTRNQYRIDPYGEYVLESTDGEMGDADTDEDDEDTFVCEDCDERYHTDELCYVGRYEDVPVCSGCRSEEYTRVYGSNGLNSDRRYYLYNNDARQLYDDPRFIDPDYPPSFAQCTENHGWVDKSEAVFVEDLWFYKLDNAIVRCADGEWYIREDCWMDDETGMWYSHNTDEPVIQPDGKMYHPSTILAFRNKDQLTLEDA